MKLISNSSQLFSRVYDHTMLLKYFGKDWNRVNGTEWMYYAYGKILEKSKHLEKQ